MEFSIDAASPECLPPVPLFSPADVLVAPVFLGNVPGVLWSAAQLGLAPFDEIDALSNGADILFPMGPNNWIVLFFSVTRGTLGVPGSVIEAQRLGNGAAGDEFVTWIRGGAPVLGTQLYADAALLVVGQMPPLGLTPLPPPPQSNLDGLQRPIRNPLGVYFSVDAATAARLTGAGLACGPADILYQSNPGPNPAPLQVWARAGLDLGLVAGDDIDALALLEPYWISGWGALDVTDIVYVSLTPTSPTLLGPDGQPGVAGVDDDGINGVDDMGEFLFPGSDDISAAAVIQVYPGLPAVVIPPGMLGLLPGDDLNAMAAWDPGKADNPYPGVGTSEVDNSPNLSWEPGNWVADINGHEVYFGTSWAEVNDANTTSAAYQGNTVGTWVDPCDANYVRYTYQVTGPLDLVTPYYWRIDEVNEAGKAKSGALRLKAELRTPARLTGPWMCPTSVRSLVGQRELVRVRTMCTSALTKRLWKMPIQLIQRYIPAYFEATSMSATPTILLRTLE
jgi:hypothetical protein